MSYKDLELLDLLIAGPIRAAILGSYMMKKLPTSIVKNVLAVALLIAGSKLLIQ
jgi:uncharacterized membrane protein YfcA